MKSDILQRIVRFLVLGTLSSMFFAGAILGIIALATPVSDGHHIGTVFSINEKGTAAPNIERWILLCRWMGLFSSLGLIGFLISIVLAFASLLSPIENNKVDWGHIWVLILFSIIVLIFGVVAFTSHVIIRI